MGKVARRLRQTFATKLFHPSLVFNKKSPSDNVPGPTPLQTTGGSLEGKAPTWWRPEDTLVVVVRETLRMSRAATRIQRWYRQILRERWAAALIARWWHSWSTRQRWVRLSHTLVRAHHSAVVIQRWYRRSRRSRQYRRQLDEVVTNLQKWCRGYLQRLKFKAMVLRREEQVNEYYFNRSLSLCNQQYPVNFEDVFANYWLRSSVEKIAQGAFGDVFTAYDPHFNLVVFKVLLVRFGPQTYARQNFTSIFSDLYISHLMNEIRSYQKCQCINFVHMHRAYVVHDKAPIFLVAATKRFESRCGKYSHHNYPLSKQHYLVYKLHFAGKSISNFKPDTEQCVSIVAQVLCALAVAEAGLMFEHRDLHLDNILLNHTDRDYVQFRLQDQVYDVPSHGLLATIIDFSYSRASVGEENVYRNLNSQYLEKSPLAVCREMVRLIGNRWENFCPKSNVLWVQSIIGKLLHKFEEGRLPLGGRCFKTHLYRMERLWESLDKFESTAAFVSSGELFAILTDPRTPD